MTHAPQKDFIAYAPIGCGGSWARDTNPDKAVSRCAKIAHSDWKHLYKVDGETIQIGLFDVTGHDEVTMSDGLIYVGRGGREPGTIVKPIEIRQVKLPGKKKKA
jgi:hypothetical protein